MIVNTLAGMRNVSPLLLNGAAAMGASRAQQVRYVIFPHMVTTVFAGLRLAMTLTLLGVVLAEIFVSQGGIGYLHAALLRDLQSRGPDGARAHARPHGDRAQRAGAPGRGALLPLEGLNDLGRRMNIVGVDIGGTFTDLVGCVDGRIVTSKTSTVPADPTRGVADSLALAHCQMPALDEVLHGSTIAINTVLERKGARTALITTRGFRDTYAIGRGNRIEAFNLFFHRPKPLIPRDLTFEVTERINAKGEVLMPLDDDEVASAAGALRRPARSRRSRSACCTPTPTRRMSGASAKFCAPPSRQLFVTLSHEIVREYREYERTSTTALNAFVGPRVQTYLRRLESFLRTEKFRRQDQHHALERRRDVDRASRRSSRSR